MLQQILNNIHNYFVRERKTGSYTISGGTLQPLDFVKFGQRIWIVGSALNDGVYTYTSDGIMNDDGTTEAELLDEEFSGTVCALAVPRDILDLSSEISAWQTQNQNEISSPYQSESFNGYSYALKSGIADSGSTPWATHFKARLDPYRRVNLCG